jgi:hypothetical protein
MEMKKFPHASVIAKKAHSYDEAVSMFTYAMKLKVNGVSRAEIRRQIRKIK